MYSISSLGGLVPCEVFHNGYYQTHNRFICFAHLGRLLLENGIENYTILNKSSRRIDGVDDREEWRQLKVCHENPRQRRCSLTILVIGGP